MLLRRHIGRILSEYYAQPSHKVVGSTPRGRDINFSSLFGEWHWKWIYRRAYRRQEGQWLTPVELFRPHYSRTVAEFVARSVRAHFTGGDGTEGGTDVVVDRPVDVVVLGGGRGTNASLVLAHLREAHPDVYDAVQYTLIDSSPTLIDLQGEILRGENSEHADKVTLLQRDAADIAEGGENLLGDSDALTVAISLELLDNLPHDKVAIDGHSGELLQAEVSRGGTDDNSASFDGGSEQEVGSSRESNGPLLETFAPLSDPLLKSVLDAVPSYVGRSFSSPRWVPTVACGLIHRLLMERPNSSLLMVDFDWLPPPDLDPNPAGSPSRRSVQAAGEPLITDMTDRDHECYLSAPGHCDVLFPTDFDKLAMFAEKIGADIGLKNPVDARVMKQWEFLEEYGGEEVEKTRSWLTGYTPLLHDFSNYSVLAVTPRIGARSGAKDTRRVSIKRRSQRKVAKARNRKR
mmetsp:Transcript_18168/g.52495  ORF Transcript_18168/g.52495 Transcript_18168/m.52495 type:complete len:461 (-) Transcript_18168:28-1410(-)